MQFRQCLSMIVTCFMLISCAGPRMAQDLQAGKASFENGYYKEAFHQLLPLAVKGKPEAQYAVGYMYYYGYGVPEDDESGIFWMTKAADQNYAPAIRALQLIQHPTAASQSIVPSRQPSVFENHQQTILRQEDVPVVAPKKMSYSEIETPQSEPPVKMASSEEEKQQVITQEAQSRKYALQLYGSYHLDAVKELQLQLRLKNTGHIYHTMNQGKDWYVLTFGRFATAHEASATQKNLPGDLKGMHPWVRDVDALHLV